MLEPVEPGPGDPSTPSTPRVVRISRDCAIGLDELSWRFGTSGGKGGQHANRARTRVDVAFDITASPSLTEQQRGRLLSRIGEVARASAEDERSQARNRALALDRLRSRLAAALREDRPRRPTRPSQASRRRRLELKRRRSALKRTRSRPRPDE